MALTRPDPSQLARANDFFDGFAAGYFRSVVGVIPLLDPHVTALQTQYGSVEVPYPQAIGFDENTDELFLVRSGINGWSWISVYDFPSLTLKRTFTLGFQLGESVIIRYSGSTRYLYSSVFLGGTVRRADITTLPANLAVHPSTDMGVVCYTQMAFDGTTFAVQTKRNYKGAGRRNIFELWDVGFTAKKGEVYFPLGLTGDFNAMMEKMPKTQSCCFHNGHYYFGCGGDWVEGVHNADDPYLHHGIRVCDPYGNLVGTALCRPDRFLATLNPHLPTGAGNMVENEGLASYKGELYALWMNRSPATVAGFPAQGMVITKECSRDGDRIDFRGAARLVPQLDLVAFEQRIHESLTQLKHPITGTTLDTFAEICQMMTELGMARYAFHGTGQTITDLNGDPVVTAGFLVEFRNLNGSTFIVDVSALNAQDNRSYWLYNNFTLQAERSTPNRWIIPGTGSPEGVVTAPVGSLYLRKDGGASTTLYVKQSGTGNTGWAAK